MRTVFALFLIFFTVSCGSEQKRNADLVVTYNNKVIHSVGPSWNSQKDLQKAIETNQRPIRVIFTASWCGYCKKLRTIIEKQKWRDHVYYLNYDEDWVKKLALMMEVQIIPTMVSFDGKDGQKVKKISGWGGIVLDLANDLRAK